MDGPRYRPRGPRHEARGRRAPAGGPAAGEPEPGNRARRAHRTRPRARGGAEQRARATRAPSARDRRRAGERRREAARLARRDARARARDRRQEGAMTVGPFAGWSDRARRVLALAREATDRLRHNYIRTEHVMLRL